MKLLVPMGLHINGLHPGHNAILDYAKAIGDETVILATPQRDEWLRYVEHGQSFVKNFNELHKTKFNKDIESNGCRVIYNDKLIIDEMYRQEWSRKSQGILDLYRPLLPNTHIIESSFKGHIPTWFGLGRLKESFDGVVWGSEFLGFLYKSVSVLMNRMPVHIMPTIIKHPNSHIKWQSRIENIPEVWRSEIYRIPSIIGSFHDKLRLGSNKALAIEVTNSYGQVWKLEDIMVFEGGFVPGRLEWYLFNFPTLISGKNVMVEEVRYEC